MSRAQRRGPRRFLGTSMKSVPSPSGLGHWRNDCVGRASVPGEDSKCNKSLVFCDFTQAMSAKSNKEGTTPGSQRLLEGNCRRDREGGSLWRYKDSLPDAGWPDWVKCYLNGMEASSQIKPESWEWHIKALLNHAALPKQRILTTAYLRGGNLPLRSRPANSGGGVHPSAGQEDVP